MNPYHVVRREDGSHQPQGVLLRASSPEGAALAWGERRSFAPCIVDVYVAAPDGRFQGKPLGTYRVERTVTVTPVTP